MKCPNCDKIFETDEELEKHFDEKYDEYELKNKNQNRDYFLILVVIPVTFAILGLFYILS